MDDRTPVLIGGGQFTYRGGPADAPTPLRLLRIAAEAAARDAGLGVAELAGLDGLGVVGFTIDAPGALAAMPVPRLANPPASLARAIGATPRWSVYSHMGGNSAQQMINIACERIAGGENDLVLAVGAEFLGSLMRKLKGGLSLDGLGEDAAEPPQRIGDPRPGSTPYEASHGLNIPANTYPLFENALRARDGRGLQAHQQRIGALFARFTKVAAENPHAWFRSEQTADELLTVAPDNRMVGFPYPKYLNAIMQVDQSAGVLIASVGKARALGVPEDRWVFLHGCADASDIWSVLERGNLRSSPAMRLTGARALAMAGIGVADLSFIDLYSCFPVAVEIGAEELGLDLDDPRGLTLTGGLPYFGGPGNNYAMHAVVTLLARLRSAPGTWGLCTANGWYLTKQSTGIYSTQRPTAPFLREDPAVLQAQIDAMPRTEVIERPQGPAVIETYTVIHARDHYRMGIVVGRDAQDRRFVAHTPSDDAVLRAMEASEQIGRGGSVRRADDDAHNLFLPA